MNPYLIISLLVAWIASLAGVGTWQNKAGHVAEREAWQGRENTELRAANDRIVKLEEGNRKVEQQHAAALADISAEYEGRLINAKQQRDSDVAAVRSGAIRLRDPGSTGLRSCGSVMPDIASSASRRDGRSTGELSAETAGFLLGLAGDADDVAHQLAACQQVIAADRAGRGT